MQQSKRFNIYKIYLGFLFIFIIQNQFALAQEVPCPDQKCIQTLQDIQRDLPEGSFTPFITNPIEDESDLAPAFKNVTNQFKPGDTFYSFISDDPSAEESKRVRESERMAKARGFEVHRIVVPVKKLKLDLPKNLYNKVTSYFGTQKIDLELTPSDIAKMPTPTERSLAKAYPLKNLIVKPLAWSAHSSPVGVAAVTFVSITYGYFTSLYWHMFRVFFNHPHFIGEGTKLGKILEKINLAELANKFGIDLTNSELKEKLESLNGRKIAEIVQYASKKFAYNLFNAELYKLVSGQGGFFTAEYHMHILTSKLYGLSYYPVSWMEDHLVLKRLIHRDTLAKILIFQSYVGGAMASLDLAGGHIPGVEVRPAVILMGFNIVNMISYLGYHKYIKWKLGLNSPEKLKEYIEHKEKIEIEVQLKVKEFTDNPNAKGWEAKFFYEKVSKLDSVEEIQRAYNLTNELIPEIQRSLNLIEEFLWLEEGFILKRKLLKVRNHEELDKVNKSLEIKLNKKPSYKPNRRLYSPYKANCLPTLNNLFN